MAELHETKVIKVHLQSSFLKKLLLKLFLIKIPLPFMQWQLILNVKTV